jgi:methylamine---glutamate N-methyltransferase subunit C
MQFILTNTLWLYLLFAIIALTLSALVFLAKPIARYFVKLVADDFVGKLLTDKYTQNLFELMPALKRFSLLNTIELSLRAETGKILSRPLGTPKHFLGFENLMFSPLQIAGLSLPENAQVDMSVTLGSTAEKPLTIGTPLMIGGMAYGLALSEEARRALAIAAKTLQTAICSGEGPYLPEERQEADKYVLQICRWSWGGRTVDQIAAADMLEVQMGHGSNMGSFRIEAAELQGRARLLGGLAPGQPAICLPAPPGIQKVADWPGFMKDLRQKAGGIPIALKLMATDRLEEDLAAAVELGFDVVVLDGAEAGAHASPPVKQDDFGIPSLHALIRAKRYLKNQTISLVVGGGYFTPGQCLKALALGADAIYLGTVPLFALVHKQVEKALPWEPLTTLVYYDSPARNRLDIPQAATNVVNVVKSMNLEMQELMRGLGKASLKELSDADLVALDSITAAVTGVKLSFTAGQVPTPSLMPLPQQASQKWLPVPMPAAKAEVPGQGAYKRLSAMKPRKARKIT